MTYVYIYLAMIFVWAAFNSALAAFQSRGADLRIKDSFIAGIFWPFALTVFIGTIVFGVLVFAFLYPMGRARKWRKGKQQQEVVR